MRPSRSGATQNQRPHPLWILKRKFLRYHSPHRKTKYMRGLHTRSIQHCGCVGRHRGHGINAGRHVALSDAAIVESNGAVALGKNRPGAMPHVGGIAEAHDKQQRFAGAAFIPIYFDPFVHNEWHGSLRIRDPRMEYDGLTQMNVTNAIALYIIRLAMPNQETLYQVADRIATITLNRPDKLNAC